MSTNLLGISGFGYTGIKTGNRIYNVLHRFKNPYDAVFDPSGRKIVVLKSSGLKLDVLQKMLYVERLSLKYEGCVLKVSQERNKNGDLIIELLQLHSNSHTNSGNALQVAIFQERQKIKSLIEFLRKKYNVISIEVCLEDFNSTIKNLKELNSLVLNALNSVLKMEGNIDASRSYGIHEECIKMGYIHKVLLASREIKDDSCKSMLLGKISVKCAELGDIDQALSIARETDDLWKSEILAVIIMKCAMLIDIDRALSLAREITDDSWKSAALSKILIKCAELGDIDRVLSAAREITDDFYKSEILANIAMKCAELGDIDRALLAVKKIANDSCKLKTLANIATQCAELGDIDRVLLAVRGITEDWWKSEALSEIAVKCAELGDIDRARSIAREITEDWWKSKALSEIAMKYASLGDIDRALSIGDY